MKKIIITLVVFAPFLALAQSATDTVATGTSATSTPATSTQITCIQSALEKRENALIAGEDIYNTAVKTALTNRLTALKDAWSQTTKKARTEKRQSANKAFKLEIQVANNAMRNTKNSAWKTFESDAKVCGIKGTGEYPISISSANSSL